MTHDPLFLTYLQVFGLGVVAALLVVVVCVLVFRGAAGAGTSLATVRAYLKGRKTYILAGAVMALGLAKEQGYIDLPTYERYAEFLTGGAILTFKAALGRVEARLAAARVVTPSAVVPPAPTPPVTIPPAVLAPQPPPWPVP